MVLRLLLVCLYLCVSTQFAIAQENLDLKSTPLIDSLIDNLPEIKTDSNAALYYHDLAYELKNVGRFDEAKEYIDKSYEISQKLNWKKGEARALNVLGIVYFNDTDYDSSIIVLNNALEIADANDLKSVKGTIYLNMSNIYSEKSDYPNALKLLISALQIFETLEDDYRIGGALINIGIIYFYQEDYEKALDYYKRSTVIYEKLNNKKSLSFCYLNIATCYYYQDKLIDCLENFHKSAKLKKEVHDYLNLCIAYQNIAEISNHLSNLESDSLLKLDGILKFADKSRPKQSLRDSAFHFLEMSIKIAEEINSEINLISGLNTLGEIYISQKMYDKALETFELEIAKSKALGLKQIEMDSYNNIYEIYLDLNNSDSALKYFRLYSNLKDSIFSMEKQKELGSEEARYNYEKEKAIQKAEYEAQLKFDQQELKRQKLYELFLAFIVIAALVIGLIIYRALRVAKRQKNEIEIQNQIIEKKNLEILSSIRYASRIQNALLKEENRLTPELPEHFIFFKPRDIVSGDFYWSVKQDNWWYLAVADCTGHGVPGAFLTMLGTAYLNEILSTEVHISPNEILNALRNKVVAQLSQSGEREDSKDGMDISLIAINLDTLEAEWSGAHNPLYLVRELKSDFEPIIQNDTHKLVEFKGNKMPIGYHAIQKDFSLRKIQLEKGDTVYLFTDGYPDQFGGPKNKKYRYKPLKELMLSLANTPLNLQKELFTEDFDKWKGNQEQLDDVCLIGLRL